MFADDRVGALFSPDRVYRYRLWRRWKPEEPALVYVMLNPSTADEIDSDATVTRCIERARRMGYGGIEVVNLFALRSTDPTALYRHEAPVGPENDQHILGYATPRCSRAARSSSPGVSTARFMGAGRRCARCSTIGRSTPTPSR